MEKKPEDLSHIKIWIATLAVAALIIGGALYLRNGQEAEPSVATAENGLPAWTPARPKFATKAEKAGDAAPVKAKDPAAKSGEGSFKVIIPVLWDGNNRLPLEHSCHRSNLSPPVEWSMMPQGTKSFVLMMDKVEGENAFNYWLLYNIPAEADGLAGNLPAQPEPGNGMLFGRNDHGVVQYTGPCDPRGKVNYRLKLVALDTVLELPAGADKTAISQAIDGHVLAVAEQPILHYLRF